MSESDLFRAEAWHGHSEKQTRRTDTGQGRDRTIETWGEWEQVETIRGGADTDDGGKNTQGEEETGPEMKDKR